MQQEATPKAKLARTAAADCQVDARLVQKLTFPERPNGTLTNGYLLEALKGLRITIEADNVRKDELLKQLEGCQ